MKTVTIAELRKRLSGVIRRGTGKLPAGWLSRRPAVAADVVAALLQERKEGL